jgi:hypothetical protein
MDKLPLYNTAYYLKPMTVDEFQKQYPNDDEKVLISDLESQYPVEKFPDVATSNDEIVE